MRRRHAPGGGGGAQDDEPELPSEPSDPDAAAAFQRYHRARRGTHAERAQVLGDAAEEMREELDKEDPIGDTGEDRRDEFPRPAPRPRVAFELAGMPSLDAEAVMEAEEAAEEEAGPTWRFRPGQRWWNRDRFDLDVESTDSADEAKRLPAQHVWGAEDSEDNDDLMWYFKLEEEPAAEESDNSEGYNDWDIDYSKDLWWVDPHHRTDATGAVYHRQVVDPEGMEDDMTTQSPWFDMAPDDVGLDRPQFQSELHAPGAANAGWEDLAGMSHRAGWPVEVALREDDDVHYTPKNAFDEHEPNYDNAFPERWYLKPLHLERLQAAYRRDGRVKPRRTPFHMNPDKPYPLLVNTKYADATFDWPETKEAFTTMGHAHHPDSEEDPLNDLVDPAVRQEAKKTRIKRFANGGAEIDLDLGDVHAQARPEDVKRTLILADHGTDYDYPVIPLSKYLKSLWRYWQPTYDNACVGMRYWAYIAIASTFVCA